MFGRDGVDTGLVDAMESNELGPSEAGKQKPSLMFKIASRSNLFYYPPPPPILLISPSLFYSALLVFSFISLFFKCIIC